jgi:hypothetical protein
MYLENNLQSFNTAIEDYSISELYNLIELDEFTREKILLKIHDLTSNIFKNNEPIKSFFYEAQNKLLNHLSNNNLDKYLHANANNNIEVTSTNHSFINAITENYENEDENEDEDEDEDEDEENNTNTQEKKTNVTNEILTTRDTIKESFVDYSKYKPTETDSGAIIEKYEIYKNLYFNTFFRIDKNVIGSVSTDCKIQLTNSLNNVIQCKLTAINIRKPFLIHTSKANNTFIIKKFDYININDFDISYVNSFSCSITIDNGYYEDSTEMETFLNNKFKNLTITLSGEILDFTQDDYEGKNLDASKFINALTFSINKNTKHCMFDLSSSYTSSDYINNFKHYEIDFTTNYVQPYSLANILGFESGTNYSTTNNIINNYKIISPKTYCTLNNPIFFCFKENISTIIETHHLFLKNNISSDKILAKINTYKGNVLNNYYIYEVLDNIDNKNNIRKYNGPIHLSDFNIKIIDHFGNLVQSITEEFTFELEVIIQEMKLQQASV